MFPKSTTASHSAMSALSVAGLLALAACTNSKTASTQAAQKPAVAEAFSIDGNGSLNRPTGYREWVFIGEPLTPNDMNGGKAPFPEFHSVYIDPASYAHYEQTGAFRDGTIIIKELVSVGSKSAVSGKGYFMGDFIGLEATIKSSKHFAEEPGNWAYFSFSNKGGPLKPTAKPFPTAACNACHAGNAKQDFVFTQYYPVLRDAQNAKTQRAKPYYEIKDGVLKRPEGYRKWVFVGEPTTPNDMNDGKAPFPEFHSVYIDPDSYKHYKSTGNFRDGTILIKELVSVGSKSAVSGKGYFMGEFIGLEATIKSSEHFPKEPGNWAYFSFSNKGGPLKPTAKAFDTASCNACHATNAAKDFVFTQYYPVLRPEKKMMGSTAPAKSEWEATASTPAKAPSEAPLQNAELFQFLKAGKYKKFPAKESKTKKGRGPHTALGRPVKVFYNKILKDSMAAKKELHPVGATAVKEMMTPKGELEGWAVMVKTGKTDEGKGWFWYEVTSASDPSKIAASGNGVEGCFSCHDRGGPDLILSGYPLK